MFFKKEIAVKKRQFLLLLSFTFFISNALAGTVNFLEVDKDIVLFSTSDTKIAASPACMTEENSELWSISLASDSGRAIYSLILTAMATNDGMALSVESANDCGVMEGVERAEKVNLVAANDDSDSSQDTDDLATKGIGLYMGDGVTRIGTVLSMGETVRSWYYAPAEGSDKIELFTNETVTPEAVYFRNQDCQGTPYMRGNTNDLGNNPSYEDGKTFRLISTTYSGTTKSLIYYGGDCQNIENSNTKRKINAYEHDDCGDSICIIK